MILRCIVGCLLAGLMLPANAQERVTAGTLRLSENGALFLAVSRGYFKAEGLDVELRAFPTAQAVVESVAGGGVDFGLAEFTAAAFDLAGRGVIKAVAAQAREQHDYEGNELIVSNAAYARGLRGYPDLANKVIAINALGSPFHYQLALIAKAKGFDLGSVTLKPLQTLDAIARAVTLGDADAAILPALYARELLVANQAKLIGWCSEVGEPQLGALFTSAKMIEGKRAIVAKFVRAYARGVADYAAALLRRDRYGKRVADAKAYQAATEIARYVYPGSSSGAGAVEAGTYFIDPHARLDAADIARQIAWYKAQGLIDKGAEARNVIDLSFTAGQ